MWDVYNLAKSTGRRPSEIIQLDPEEYPWQAFCLDKAVFNFGTAVSNDLQAVEGKTVKERESKQQRVMDRYFPAPGGKRFADPAKAQRN